MVAALVVIAGQDVVATHTCDPTDPDTDGDGLPDSCDPIPADRDVDSDNFSDSLEVWAGTAPDMQCTSSPTLSTFPPDHNNDNKINLLDLNSYAWPKETRPFNTKADDPNFRPRYDLNANEAINLVDVNGYNTKLSPTCPFVPWTWPGPSHKVTLRSGTIHFPKAQVWYSNIGNIYVESDPDVPGIPTCDEVKRPLTTGATWPTSTFPLASRETATLPPT